MYFIIFLQQVLTFFFQNSSTFKRALFLLHACTDLKKSLELYSFIIKMPYVILSFKQNSQIGNITKKLIVLKAHLSLVLNIIQINNTQTKVPKHTIIKDEKFLFKSKTCKLPSRLQLWTMLSFTIMETLSFWSCF